MIFSVFTMLGNAHLVLEYSSAFTDNFWQVTPPHTHTHTKVLGLQVWAFGIPTASSSS